VRCYHLWTAGDPRAGTEAAQLQHITRARDPGARRSREARQVHGKYHRDSRNRKH
jgi:hypothetical protein